MKYLLIILAIISITSCAKQKATIANSDKLELEKFCVVEFAHVGEDSITNSHYLITKYLEINKNDNNVLIHCHRWLRYSAQYKPIISKDLIKSINFAFTNFEIKPDTEISIVEDVGETSEFPNFYCIIYQLKNDEEKRIYFSELKKIPECLDYLYAPFLDLLKSENFERTNISFDLREKFSPIAKTFTKEEKLFEFYVKALSPEETKKARRLRHQMRKKSLNRPSNKTSNGTINS